MMTKQSMHFGLLLTALVGVFLAMVGYQEYVLNTGETVILKTAPVDPRDIFRGDYVILGYEVADDAAQMLEQDNAIKLVQEAVYVVLDTSVSPAVAQSVSETKPLSGTFLKGELSRRWNRQRITFPSLAQYYVPEGRGRALERLRGDDLMVEVKINDGQARIVNLLHKNGEVVDVMALD